MDIKTIGNGIASALISQKGRQEKGGAVSFQELLKEAGEKLDEGSAPGSPFTSDGIPPFALSPALSLSTAELLIQDDVSSVRSRSIETTEHTLNLLEKYQAALADPQVSLKEFGQWIQSLSEEIRNLRALAETLSPSDPLQKLVTEAGIISAVEVEKFNRGEYIG